MRIIIVSDENVGKIRKKEKKRKLKNNKAQGLRNWMISENPSVSVIFPANHCSYIPF